MDNHISTLGYRTLVFEVFAGDDPYLDQDAVFGVREDLVMFYKDMPAGSFPRDMRCQVKWMDRIFKLILT
ncbi:hypothetical protein [Sulfitobacter sp.]|uniref:hypothetical protein n=1 Tax=Sulfitobacter sp. TaxID=1903071 RepID=UPI003002C964